MLTQSNSSENNESYKPVINKNNITVNRGVELLLNGGKKESKINFTSSLIRWFAFLIGKLPSTLNFL